MRKTSSRFKVAIPLDGSKEATVTIIEGRIFEVRPKGKHHTYTMTLAAVAELVAYKVAKIRASMEAAR